MQEARLTVRARPSAALLASGKRTVSSCLCMTGRAEAINFATHHQILNRARWRTRTVARRLLTMFVERFVPDGPVFIGMDDTIEHRWGRRINARENIPQPSPLQAGPFRQGQRAALAELHGANAPVMDQPDQGLAGPDLACSIRASQPPTRWTVQAVDGPGSAGRTPVVPLGCQDAG